MNKKETAVKEMTMQEIKDALGHDFTLVTEHKKIKLEEIKPGETFKDSAGMEWIVLEIANGSAKCITKEFVLENTKFDDETNDFAKSSLYQKLKNDILPGVLNAFGEDNVVEFETDLTSDDNLDDYGTVTGKISLLTDRQYREYAHLINPVEEPKKYEVNDWWWLATPLSTPKREVPYSVRCVLPRGGMNDNGCYFRNGVRPFCIFKSDIFVSQNNA